MIVQMPDLSLDALHRRIKTRRGSKQELGSVEATKCHNNATCYSTNFAQPFSPGEYVVNKSKPMRAKKQNKKRQTSITQVQTTKISCVSR